MIQYIIKRLLLFIPTLLIISTLTFIISVNAPGDPVDQIINRTENPDMYSGNNFNSSAQYKKVNHLLGLDLPVFYFSVTSAAYSDTLYKIVNRQHREWLERLCYFSGNQNNTLSFYNSMLHFEQKLEDLEVSGSETGDIRQLLNRIFLTHDPDKIEFNIASLGKKLDKDLLLASLIPDFINIEQSFKTFLQGKTAFLRYVPKLNWYGTHNQYHRWIFGDAPWFGKEKESKLYSSKGLLRGDFGISYKDFRPILTIIWGGMKWTILLSVVSMFFAYLIGVPLGVLFSKSGNSTSGRVSIFFLFFLYALPDFWIATMLIVFLAGGDYLSWFPPFGLSSLPSSVPFFEMVTDNLHHLVLPVFCLTYASVAIIIMQVKRGMLQSLSQYYIKAARARGINENRIFFKHAFKNALLPLITLIAGIFPAVISGSFVIENIFSIPGMGKLTFDAFMVRNYPVIYATVIFSAFLTLLGILLADIFYAMADPRFKITGERN